MSIDYVVRPMTLADLGGVERLTDATWTDVDARTQRAGSPPPQSRSPEQVESWLARMRHDLERDARGCWVAEGGTGLLGAAIGLRRDLTWLLATYVVRVDVQGRGVGRQLLDAALTHGSGCLRAMVSCSDDPAAVRRYRLAGLTLHPTMQLRGVVPRTVLPVVERVRQGSAGDVDLMDSVDRQVRGAAHGPDHAVLLARHRLVVADRSTGSGYAYVDLEGAPQLLAATNRRTASDLLWECLAGTSPERPVAVSHVTAANEWALDVGLAARLGVWTKGYLALRGMKPPMPYLHSGHYL